MNFVKAFANIFKFNGAQNSKLVQKIRKFFFNLKTFNENRILSTKNNLKWIFSINNHI